MGYAKSNGSEGEHLDLSNMRVVKSAVPENAGSFQARETLKIGKRTPYGLLNQVKKINL